MKAKTKKASTTPVRKPAAKASAAKAKQASAKKPAPAKKTVPAGKSKAAPSKASAPRPSKADFDIPSKEIPTRSLSAKAAAARKKPVKHGKKPPAKPAKRQQIRITKVQRPPLEPEGQEYNNNSQALAFSFAERMKKAQRAEGEKAERDAEAANIKLSRRPKSRTKSGKDPLKFSNADLADFKKRLIIMRQTALGQAATLRTIALEQTDERGGEDEDGSDAFLRLQNLGQVDSQNRIVQKIDEALHRISEGTYGVCEVCGQLIRKPRLLNLPFVHTCMECQSAMEGAQ